MTRMLKNFMRNKKPMWHCGESKCLLLNSWRCSTCNCVDELTNGLMDGIAMASVEPEVVKAPKKKRSKKKKEVANAPETNVSEEENVDDIPEILSLDELSK